MKVKIDGQTKQRVFIRKPLTLVVLTCRIPRTTESNTNNQRTASQLVNLNSKPQGQAAVELYPRTGPRGRGREQFNTRYNLIPERRRNKSGSFSRELTVRWIWVLKRKWVKSSKN